MKSTLKKAPFTALAVMGLGLHAAPALATGEPTGLEPCLNYFTVGVSGCVPAKVTPTTPARPVSPTAPAQAAQAPAAAPVTPTLDNKINDFLENHGKPPREFVAFYLEPTADNAMKWISKYNEIVDRNIQLTIAWAQAETLYKRELASGTDPSALVSSTLPPVPNFGVAIPGFTDNPGLANTRYAGFGGSMFIAAPPAIPGIDPQTGALGAMPLATVQSLNPNGSLGGAVPAPATPALPAAAPATTPALSGVTMQEDITYYYSSLCPYCKKFTPELAASLKALPGVNMSCVDLTPTGASKATLPEGVPCTWREPAADELTTQGIRQTPTLLIKGPGGYPLRISGYVDEERLRSYFAAAGLLAAPQ